MQFKAKSFNVTAVIDQPKINDFPAFIQVNGILYDTVLAILHRFGVEVWTTSHAIANPAALTPKTPW